MAWRAAAPVEVGRRTAKGHRRGLAGRNVSGCAFRFDRSAESFAAFTCSSGPDRDATPAMGLTETVVAVAFRA